MLQTPIKPYRKPEGEEEGEGGGDKKRREGRREEEMLTVKEEGKAEAAFSGDEDGMLDFGCMANSILCKLCPLWKIVLETRHTMYMYNVGTSYL